MGPLDFYAYSDITVTQSVKHYRPRLICTVYINQGMLPRSNGGKYMQFPLCNASLLSFKDDKF